MPKEFQSLTSSLYIENIGTIDLEANLYTHEPKAEIKVWSTPKEQRIWNGTAQEFWNLILKGIEATKEA